eukprot:gene9672-22944_t
MEFDFSVRNVLRKRLGILNTNQAMRHGSTAQRDAIVDTIGKASAKAQGLPGIITTSQKLRHSGQRMYILADIESEPNKVLGFIKTGEKKLFLHDHKGKMREVTPTCVLDFYVHESCQRTGFGRVLFDHMLVEEKIHPYKLAVDKPSKKCFGFLAKHYGLKDYRPQSNNYAVFRQFWEPAPAQPSPGNISIMLIRRSSSVGSSNILRIHTAANLCNKQVETRLYEPQQHNHQHTQLGRQPLLPSLPLTGTASTNRVGLSVNNGHVNVGGSVASPWGRTPLPTQAHQRQPQRQPFLPPMQMQDGSPGMSRLEMNRSQGRRGAPATTWY